VYYYRVLRYYGVLTRYWAFKSFVLLQDFLYHNGGQHQQDQLQLWQDSLTLNTKFVPVLKEFVLGQWIKQFEQKFVREMPIEDFMQKTIGALKFVPHSQYPVLYFVNRLTVDHLLHRKTRIRIMKNGFVVTNVHVCSSVEVSHYIQERQPVTRTMHHQDQIQTAARVVAVTWTWNFSHASNTSTELYQYVNDMAKSFALSGVAIIVCTQDPRHQDVVVQCFDQHNILLLWCEQLDLDIFSLCMGEGSIIEVDEHLRQLRQKCDSNEYCAVPLDVHVQLIQQHVPEDENDAGSVWCFDREMTEKNHRCATILIFGSLEHEVEELFNEIQGQMAHLRTYTTQLEKNIPVVDSGCIFEGHLIRFLRNLSKQLLMRGTISTNNSTTLDTNSRMTLSKMCKIFSNVVEEEPLHIVKNFSHSSQEMHILKVWYDQLDLEAKNQSVNHTPGLYLTETGLQDYPPKHIHLWKECHHILHSTFELLGVLLRTRIEAEE